MTEQYTRPKLPNAPHVPDWVPPSPTKEDIDWAKLRTIDLSLLDSSDPVIVETLVQTCKAAIREDGFLYLTNYGIPLSEVMRQFSIAQYNYNHMSDEDKLRLKWDSDGGLFAGYKPPFGWKTQPGARDGIQHFNFYRKEFAEWKERTPTCLAELMPEIDAFCTYLSESVNRRLLTLLSKSLELPDEFLWAKVQSHGGPVGDGYFRHALFSPVKEEGDAMKQSGGLRMNGHTDYGTTTLLFSTPISCLQIWCKDLKWRYVKYEPGALIINIGETLEIVSGGHFKATNHRVYQPPADQLDKERLSIVHFNASAGDLRTEPASEAPLIQREGCVNDQGVYCQFKALRDRGMPVPTNKEWREAHIANPRPITNNPDKVVLVNGVKMWEHEWLGVKVVLPA